MATRVTKEIRKGEAVAKKPLEGGWGGREEGTRKNISYRSKYILRVRGGANKSIGRPVRRRKKKPDTPAYEQKIHPF